MGWDPWEEIKEAAEEHGRNVINPLAWLGERIGGEQGRSIANTLNPLGMITDEAVDAVSAPVAGAPPKAAEVLAPPPTPEQPAVQVAQETAVKKENVKQGRAAALLVKQRKDGRGLLDDDKTVTSRRTLLGA